MVIETTLNKSHKETGYGKCNAKNEKSISGAIKINEKEIGDHLNQLVRQSVVEDITEALWGSKVSSSTVSELNQKIYSKIESWRMQPIHGEHPYIFVDGVYLKRSWGGEVQNVSVLVAIGVNAEGSREDKESWSNFFRYLKDRGLKGVKLVISDKASGLVDILGDFFPAAQWQRCVVHWYRNAFNKCPYKHVKTVAAMLKAIHAQEDKEAARQKAVLVADKLRGMKLDSVAKFVEDSVAVKYKEQMKHPMQFQKTESTSI